MRPDKYFVPLFKNCILLYSLQSLLINTIKYRNIKSFGFAVTKCFLIKCERCQLFIYFDKLMNLSLLMIYVEIKSKFNYLLYMIFIIYIYIVIYIHSTAHQIIYRDKNNEILLMNSFNLCANVNLNSYERMLLSERL